MLLLFGAWLAFLGEDKPRRGSGKYSQPQNVPVINPQHCLELGDAGNMQDFGQQVLVCYCRGTREQGAAHRDARRVLEGEEHKLFGACLSTAHRAKCCGGFGGFEYFSEGFQVCLSKDLGCARRAGHVQAQGQSR